jgi:hypothetical protein
MDAGPHLEPDRDAMWRHISTLFGGDFDGAADGLVELAWTDAEPPHRLGHGQQFGTDELEQLVDRAFELNRRPCVNVYVGAALRKPDTPRNARAKDSHFLCAPFDWYDHDEYGARAAVDESKKRGVPATITVVTGRHPILRLHLYWRLVEACRDPMLMRALCVATAKALGGDTSVVNPSRIMRIGGSLAWPTKPGRILELTEVHIPDDGRPNAYWFATLMERFGDGMPLAAPTPPALPKPAPENEPEIAPDVAGVSGLAIGSHSVEALLAAIRAGRRWHDNTVRLVAHWLARGWSNAEILAVAPALSLPGWTAAQTQADLARMIEGGRRKWNIPNPTHEVDDAEQAPFVLQPIGLLDPSKRSPRNWLVRHRLMRKHTTVTAAAPGVGKSTLTIEEAVSLASGMDFLGFGIDRPLKVALINNEETRDELERRIEATCIHFEVPFTSIAETFYPHSGVDAEKLVIARRGPNDSVLIQPRARQLSEFLREAGIDLLVLDPFVQLHTVSENVNEEIEQVMMALREISVSADCALHLVHHTRKPPAGTAHQAGDIFAVRGGGAIVGDAHFVFTLADMGQADGEALGVAAADRKRFIRLDDAKGKLAPPSGARWFEREGVTMPYGLLGEQVGVLVPHSFEEAQQGGLTTFQAIEILKEIDQRWREGNPLSASPQSPRYVVPIMVRHGLSPKAARRLLADWIANGLVAIEVLDSHSKVKGLRVLAWPG